MSQSPAWYLNHCKDITAYGPLPKGVEVTGKDAKQKYHIRVKGVQKTFSYHPLSSSGRQEWGSLLGLAGEERGQKAVAHRVAHPPIVYRPSEWIWERGQNLQQVMVKAFQLSNRQVALESFEAQGNKKAVEKLISNQRELYHPRDRELFATFDNEHLASCWARYFGRGLIVVCPEICKNRGNYGTLMNPIADKRTAVRARWSTGDQEDLPPIILGCLPSSEKFLKEPSGFTTTWYALMPTQNYLESFQKRWSGCRWSEQASRFNYTKSEAFTWAVVAIQRSIVLGALNVQDEDLGDYIMQYGRYLVAKDGHGSKDFVFQKSQNTNLPKVTFRELTIWILASDEKSSAKTYAKAWDKAIRANVRYRRSLTLSDWSLFVQSAAAAQVKK